MTAVAATVALLTLATLAATMVVPPRYLPSYRRGGWGRHAR